MVDRVRVKNANARIYGQMELPDEWAAFKLSLDEAGSNSSFYEQWVQTEGAELPVDRFADPTDSRRMNLPAGRLVSSDANSKFRLAPFFTRARRGHGSFRASGQNLRSGDLTAMAALGQSFANLT
jgi:hypothetical protein